MFNASNQTSDLINLQELLGTTQTPIPQSSDSSTDQRQPSDTESATKSVPATSSQDESKGKPAILEI